MARISILLFLLSTLLVFIGCSDDTATPDESKGDWLTGQMVDVDGDPVADVAVIMVYTLPTKTGRSTTTFKFDLPDTVHFDAWIEDPCRGEIVREMMDEHAVVGSVSVVWDGRDDEGLAVLSNGYEAYLDIDGEVSQSPILLMWDSYPADADPAAYRAHAVTDAAGRFEFSQECLAFDSEWTSYDEQGNETGTITIGRQVRFFGLHADYVTGVSDWVTADVDTGCAVTITLEPEA